jgi:hypothetical protein
VLGGISQNFTQESIYCSHHYQNQSFIAPSVEKSSEDGMNGAAMKSLFTFYRANGFVPLVSMAGLWKIAHAVTR